MRSGQLRDYFTGVGVKRLTAVDAEPIRSNQHEVGTTRAMRRDFLGEIHRQYQTAYIWFGDDQDVITANGTTTHYDVRERDPGRSPEWRLYYKSNPVTEVMQEGDTLFLLMSGDRRLYFVVASADSISEEQLSWLFGLRPAGQSFVSREFQDDEQPGCTARYILEELGISVEGPDADTLDGVIERFGTGFPPTAEFSATARRSLPGVRAEDDPDAALVTWLDHEEALFRRLEGRVIAARLEEGFVNDDGIDVDGFVSFSLSVQNRRKSRMGYALENHLEAIFRAFGIAHDRGAETRDNSKPDFLFPGVKAYNAAPASGAPHLIMLGAKSTCKDRWRQVLNEAAKIPRKHLLTLQPGISEAQTEQMDQADLQLVVPRSIQDSYTDGQRAWLWDLARFIRHVESRARK